MSHKHYNYKAHWESSNYGAGPDHQWDEHIKKFLIPGTVLDIGCGAGRFTETLAANPYDKNYLGIDIAGAAISVAVANNPHLNFSVQDIVTWEPEDTYDNVFTWTVLEHLPHEVMKGVAEKLKRIGKNIIMGEPFQEGVDDTTWAAHCHNHNYKELFDVIEEIDLGSIKLYRAKGEA